jgi:hypothetical protein
LQDGKTKDAKTDVTKPSSDATTSIQPPAADGDDLADEDSETTNHIERLDPIKTETLNILDDLIDLSHNPKPATASTSK